MMMLPGYLKLRCFTSCYQCIYQLGGGYMDAWMNFSILQLVSETYGVRYLYTTFVLPRLERIILEES